MRCSGRYVPQEVKRDGVVLVWSARNGMVSRRVRDE